MLKKVEDLINKAVQIAKYSGLQNADKVQIDAMIQDLEAQAELLKQECKNGVLR